ncbi:MAG TPA: hypothetical protein DCZ95_20030 [Verrucomicrobia bacterium]|nr:MAG: hypothetical protein A2X46_17935 [Lentisphaerae bacterium GWF2_57_35]HBA86375.1 hypothetical protein [Verrucomicrobiota bacterium]
MPNRQSIRKEGWDYTAPGWYFVTCNTQENRPLFGAVVNGRIVLSEAGRVAEECWREIPAHFSGTHIDEFVIMPDHLHGLFRAKRFSPVFFRPWSGPFLRRVWNTNGPRFG